MTIHDPRQALIEDIFINNLNMAFPMQGRKWLRLLEEHPDFGLRIKPSLKLGEAYLGFQFSSNALGLRGPANCHGKGVILGTSFAMGFAVDDGQNWYDTPLFHNDFLNLGLPVGLGQMQAMLDHHYAGSANTAIFVYHPNIWTTCADFARWQTSGQTLFESMRWETDLAAALDKSLAKVRAIETGAGGQIIEMLDNRHYLLNTNYATFNPDQFGACYADATTHLNAISARFKKLIVIRVPIKEELAAGHTPHDSLHRLCDNHQQGWAAFKEALSKTAPHAEVHENLFFSLTDYHPYDTHWNENGNNRFREHILPLLN